MHLLLKTIKRNNVVWGGLLNNSKWTNICWVILFSTISEAKQCFKTSWYIWCIYTVVHVLLSYLFLRTFRRSAYAGCLLNRKPSISKLPWPSTPTQTVMLHEGKWIQDGGSCIRIQQGGACDRNDSRWSETKAPWLEKRFGGYVDSFGDPERSSWIRNLYRNNLCVCVSMAILVWGLAVRELCQKVSDDEFKRICAACVLGWSERNLSCWVR